MKSRIGQSFPRPDAIGKVTGAASYPADLVRPGMLHLQVVFAERVHARILAIEKERALQHSGVVAVLTAEDVPQNAYGLITPDQPVLCGETVRFAGDKVALVVAESKRAAREGAKLVSVEYSDLPAVTDPHQALRPEAPLVHAHTGSNVLLHVPIRKGDAQAALAKADVVLEETFTTTWQEHAYLQPEAGIAFIDAQGRLVIETAGQWLHEDQRQIARILQLPEEQVIVRYAAIGGAFGGREDLSIQPLLALATWKLQRPTAIVWDREESIKGHHKRHPITIHCRWGANRDGKIVAVQTQLLADGGAYASTSVEVIKIATLLSCGCYEVPHIMADGSVVYTNNIPCGAFRGFGSPQVQFASEVMVTRLAQALGLDPLEMRRRNLYREGSLEASQNPLPLGVSAGVVLERCIEEVAHHFGKAQEQPAREEETHLRRGVGIACGIKNIGYSFGYPEQATGSITVFGHAELERAEVRIGAADVGQGAHLILRQIAAETLQLPLERVSLLNDDSQETPDAGSASASRMTLMGGSAVYEAALAAKQQWSYTDDDSASATIQYRAPVTTELDPVTGAGIPNFCYSYCAQAVEIEVNTLTGFVRVIKIVSVHDVGKAINPQLVEGQIEGCLAQALGYALLEHFQVANGQIRTPSLSTYLLPTILDMPEEMLPVIIEEADVQGPFGARGVAEMPLVAFLPAIASAIHDAIGVWCTDQPITPERILTTLAGR